MTAFGESLKARTGLPVYYYTNFLAYYLKEIDPWIYSRFKVMTLTIPMGTVFEEKSLPNKNYDESIRNALQKGNVLISGFFEDCIEGFLFKTVAYTVVSCFILQCT